jgi:hypothetical protein
VFLEVENAPIQILKISPKIAVVRYWVQVRQPEETMKPPGNPQYQRWAFFDGYIAITRSPMYGIHIQVGRWMIGRETPESYGVTKVRRHRYDKERGK